MSTRASLALLVLLAASACGRLDFGPVAATGDAALTDGDLATDIHVTVSGFGAVTTPGQAACAGTCTYAAAGAIRS